jgi:large subunit ribosomal protein L30e
MVAQKKQKKAIESINSRLALVMKSGKFCLGYKQTLKVSVCVTKLSKITRIL